MKRKANWQPAFWEAINAACAEPFAWGERDCATFAIRCAQAIVEDDIAALVAREIGEWHSIEDGVRLTREGMDPLVRRVLGEPVPWTRLRQGDVALALNEGRELLCVHDGCQFVARGASGLIRIPFAQIQHGWRIG